MRSNSTVLANFSDNSNRCDAMTGSLKSNEKNSGESSQDPTKRYFIIISEKLTMVLMLDYFQSI